MEQLVEEYASRLMPSLPPTKVYDALTELKQLKGQGAEDPCARARFSRLLQELLAYKRGAFVEEILHKVLDLANCGMHLLSGENQRIMLSLHAFPVLVALAESQVIARFCVQDEVRARKLARAFMEAHRGFLGLFEEDGSRKDPIDVRGLHLALQMIEGLVNFSRGSKIFRLAVRGLDDLFPALEHLLSDKIAGLPSLPIGLATWTVDDILRLTHALTVSEEGQQWAVDQGLIRIYAAIARLSTSDTMFED